MTLIKKTSTHHQMEKIFTDRKKTFNIDCKLLCTLKDYCKVETQNHS